MPPTWPVEDVNGVQPAALSLSATISQYFIFLFFNIGPSNTALANVTRANGAGKRIRTKSFDYSPVGRRNLAALIGIVAIVGT
jgi:hypothetical protein